MARGPGVLDQIGGPVDLSTEVARKGVGSPVPTEAELVKPTSTTSRELEMPAIKAAIDPAPLAPGLKRFAGVKPNISGGSLPNQDGLEWLKEKGIKTILDLREAADVDQSFVDRAKAKGFRYVSLPIIASKPDPAMLARFRDEITNSANQPVFFFDTEGVRSGLAWYLHRLTVDKVDAQVAGREAEELGLADKTVWVAAARYLEANKPDAGNGSPTKVDAPPKEMRKTPILGPPSASRLGNLAAH